MLFQKISLAVSAFCVLFASYSLYVANENLHNARENLRRVQCQGQIKQDAIIIKARHEHGEAYANMMIDVLRKNKMYVEGFCL